MVQQLWIYKKCYVSLGVRMLEYSRVYNNAIKRDTAFYSIVTMIWRGAITS
jgi:hypothetical protein